MRYKIKALWNKTGYFINQTRLSLKGKSEYAKTGKFYTNGLGAIIMSLLTPHSLKSLRSLVSEISSNA